MKYQNSTISIVQYGSVSVTSRKNHGVFTYKHTYSIYVYKKKKPFILLDLLGYQILAPSAACRWKQS